MKPTFRGLVAVVVLCAHLPYALSQTDFSNAITQNLGWPSQPLDSDPIAPLEDYGTLDGIGEVGYQVGDTVADFTVYDFNGNALTLSEELTGEKPVILMNSSVSCIRFRNLFDETVDSQDNNFARAYILEHLNDFNWIFIYNLEAHPSDGNCPSNCPPVPTLDTAVTQGPDYHYRRYAMHNWETHGYPYNFPFTMYCDNPDNSVYNHFSRRPFGILAINCEGIVIGRGDWANQFITFEQSFMDSLLVNEFQQCEIIEEEEEEEEEEETVNITESSVEAVTVYPNPATGRFRIDGMEGLGRVRIFEVSGRMIEELGNQSLSEEVVVDHLPGGCYVVQITPQSGDTVHLPLILE